MFQGCYKSLLVTEPRPLLGLIDYIHLNPLRAGLYTVQTLKSHSLSSYPKYWDRFDLSDLLRFYGAAGGKWRMRVRPEAAYLPGMDWSAYGTAWGL